MGSLWQQNKEHEKEVTIFENLKVSLTCQDNKQLIYVGKLLERAYHLYPEKIALIAPDRSITYKEFFFRSVLLSKLLLTYNVNPGNHVIIYYENSVEFYIAYFAILQLGAVAVPLNIFLHEKELTHILNDSNPCLIIVSPTLKPNIDKLLITQPVLSQEVFDWDSPVPKHPEETLGFNICEQKPDNLAVLLYTSGTTGVPKGVMLSSKNIMTNALQGYARFQLCGMTDKESFLCVLPLFHVFAQNACVWLPIITGSSIIIVPKIDRRLLLEGLEKKPTIFMGFPALYGLLCLMKTAPLDSIKIFVSGADMLPDKIRSAFAIIYGRKICSGYGLSEASPVVAVNHENSQQPTYYVGKLVTGLTCDIRDDEGKPVSPDTIGNLFLKGDNIMIGYYNSPEATSKILVDGWLNTGDLASLDATGNLSIRGRSKDIIIHKGFNIYPAEVENILMQHPAVFKAAVIGQDEAMTGQIAVAFVAFKQKEPGVLFDIEQELRTLCAHNLAAYKVPRQFVCLEDLPMNATGKIDKKRLLQSSFDK